MVTCLQNIASPAKVPDQREECHPPGMPQGRTGPLRVCMTFPPRRHAAGRGYAFALPPAAPGPRGAAKSLPAAAAIPSEHPAHASRHRVPTRPCQQPGARPCRSTVALPPPPASRRPSPLRRSRPWPCCRSSPTAWPPCPANWVRWAGDCSPRRGGGLAHLPAPAAAVPRQVPARIRRQPGGGRRPGRVRPAARAAALRRWAWPPASLLQPLPALAGESAAPGDELKQWRPGSELAPLARRVRELCHPGRPARRRNRRTAGPAAEPVRPAAGKPGRAAGRRQLAAWAGRGGARPAGRPPGPGDAGSHPPGCCANWSTSRACSSRASPNRRRRCAR